MREPNGAAYTEGILREPPAHEIAWLEEEVMRRLTALGIVTPSRHLQRVVMVTRMLLPELPLDAVIPMVLQALWIYLTDALVDGSISTSVLEEHLHSWQAQRTPDKTRLEPGHRLLRLLQDELARGVLAAIRATSGVPIDERLSATLVHRDMETSWEQLNRTLGPQSTWTPIDWMIARLAQLLHSGYAQ